MDPRYAQLAAGLTGFSLDVQPGEKVLIDAFDVPDLMVVALVRAVRSRGGVPFVQLNHARVTRELLLGATEGQYGVAAEAELYRMKLMDCYVALRGSPNIFEQSDVPGAHLNLMQRIMRPVQDERVSRKKWVVLRWPTGAMAQQAGMSTEAFEDFFFRVCTLDYARLQPGMAALKARLERADRVHIKGPGMTDLRFSIKGIAAIPCGGRRNIPDGELFTCPVRDSVEGVIAYNTPSLYQGTAFENIVLRFERGRIVEATAGDKTARLNEILDSDEGARYIGEFALGFNPHILQPMRDTLFDEKIAGSLHFTPGQAYEIADNGNRSQVHWDIVLIQRPEYGGGQIFLDGELIRQDGLFTVPGLDLLNPDKLLG